MRAYWAALVALAGGVLLAGAALIVEAASHPDGCHRWHSCPSDDGSYVCGDLGHCSECPDNQFCFMGRKRGASPEATRTRRPTQTREPTNTPRPTRTPEPPSTPRPARTAESNGAARAPREGADAGRPSADSSRPPASADGAAPPGDLAPDDPRVSGALGGTGAPLAAAPPRPAAPSSAGGGAPDRVVVAAEYAGIRVLGPLQWTTEAGLPAIAGLVHHGGAEARTMVLSLFLLDPRGERLGTTELVLWDLAPGETRTFAQPLPTLPAAPTDVSARIEPLGP
jgi:hypothetical protein